MWVPAHVRWGLRLKQVRLSDEHRLYSPGRQLSLLPFQGFLNLLLSGWIAGYSFTHLLRKQAQLPQRGCEAKMRQATTYHFITSPASKVAGLQNMSRYDLC